MQTVIDLGKRIKTIRVYSGIKQKNLAKELNVSPSLLSMYEQGQREPSLTFLSSFCEHFDISLSHLFSFESNKNLSDFSIPTKELLTSLQQLLGKLEKEKFSNINA